MAKPPRSPLVGYNHNLTHLGRVFHIQTEDSGPVSPRLFTHLFYEGTILVSRKHEYDAALPDDKVRSLMQTQHKTVMKDLLRAQLDGVIIPFFSSRGEDLVPVQGAVPSASLSERPEPMMVLPESAPAAPAAPGDEAPPLASPAPPAPSPTAASGHRRTATRSFEPTTQRASTPTPVVVRAPDTRRSPFVRSGPPAPARMSSADGVVVHRNVVVGGASSSRPTRIRPPVPYVVTGGGHTERPPKSIPAGAAATPPPAMVTSPPLPPGITASNLAPLAGPLASSAGAVPSDGAVVRGTSAFGVGLADDKSLDEVILEYLSDDGDPG